MVQEVIYQSKRIATYYILALGVITFKVVTTIAFLGSIVFITALFSLFTGNGSTVDLLLSFFTMILFFFLFYHSKKITTEMYEKIISENY